jgi:nucleoside-diphosphate-sugar epimerase
MHIGIIGANGFIGSYLHQRIKNQTLHTVTCWDRSLHGDFLSKKSRERFVNLNSFDIIFQLAWSSIDNVNYRYHPENLLFSEATIDFVELCILRRTKVVVLGTDAENEDFARDEYLTAKMSLFESVSAIKSPLIYFVRPTYVFSIEHRRPHLFRLYIDWVENNGQGKGFPLRSPTQVIDLIHVKDVADSLFYIATEIREGAFYTVASGISVSVQQALNFLKFNLNKSISHTSFSVPLKTKLKPGMNYLLFNNHSLPFFRQSDLLN